MAKTLAKLGNKGFFGLLSKSFEIYTSNFWQILPIILLVYVPIQVVQSLVSITAATGWQEALTYMLILFALIFTLGVVAALAIPIFVEAKITNRKMDFRGALLRAAERWPAAFGTYILLTLFLAGLMLLLVIPAIYFSVYWTFAVIAIALRGKNYMDALNYSKSLVKGNWWNVFGTVLMLGIIVSVLAGIVSLPFSLIGQTFFSKLASGIVASVIGAFMSIALTVYFLRMEK